MPAIRVENLSKQYRLGAHQDGYRTLRESLTEAAAAPFRRLHGAARRAFNSDYQGDTGDGRNGDTLWALKDVSFDVEPGEVVGIIGRNGAGKSTLLKVLSRITEPSSGRIALHGRVGSLLEVGTGFHPELTGRENIYMNGAILGMSRQEIDRKFDEIVDFSEVEQFVDTPVKRYSSGMQVRLAFAVAAHLEPEVLIVDEVLAVGDIAFQQKCTRKMRSISQGGRTILFVSHNLQALAALCERAIVLRGGELVFASDVGAAIRHYRSLDVPSDGRDGEFVPEPQGRENTGTFIKSVRTTNKRREQGTSFPVGSEVHFEVDFENSLRRRDISIAIFISTLERQRLMMLHTLVNSGLQVSNDCGTLHCVIPSLPLLATDYDVDIFVGSSAGILESHERILTLRMTESNYLGTNRLPSTRQGVVAIPAQWSFADAIPERTP